MVFVGPGSGATTSAEVFDWPHKPANPAVTIPDYPLPVERTAADQVAGKATFCGGQGGGRECHVLDPDSLQWEYFPPMSYERNYPAEVVLPGGKWMVFGGGASESEIFDPAAWSWSMGPDIPDVFTDGFCAALVNDDTVFLFGGWSGEGHVLHLSSGTWEKVTDVPDGVNRYHHKCTGMSNERVVVVGGEHDGHYKSTVQVFHYNTKTWQDGPDLPIEGGIKGFGLVSSGEDLVVFGGVDGSYVPSNKIYYLSNIESSWELMSYNLRSARIHFSTFGIDASAIGGSSSPTTSPYTTRTTPSWSTQSSTTQKTTTENSDCPGGSLDVCISLCPVEPVEFYQKCVDQCLAACNYD